MIISAIEAVARNGEIGKDKSLPWRLPADLQYFKKVTSGHHIILGRKNYQDIGRPLPNRVNIVLSRDLQFQAEGCVVCASLEQAFQVARDAQDAECFVIGGAEVYRLAMPQLNRLYLTLIDEDFAGDVAMPALGTGWKEVWSESHEPDEKNLWPYKFIRYDRGDLIQ